MAQFLNAIVGYTLPEPVSSVFCIMFVMLFFSLCLSAIRSVIDR